MQKWLEMIIVLLARWHMMRYCKLMKKVIDTDLTPEEIYRKIMS